MLNQCVLVGRVAETPEMVTTSKGVAIAHMLIETDRNFRNEDGSLSKDVFQVTLWKGIAEECATTCTKGSIVAMRGRLSSDLYEKDGKKFYNSTIIAEKVSRIDNRQ